MMLELYARDHILGLDPDTLGLISFQSTMHPELELAVKNISKPAFAIHFLNEKDEFEVLYSSRAKNIRVQCQEDAGNGSRLLSATYDGFDISDLSVEITVEASRNEDLSRWRIGIDNRSDLRIVHVEFPFAVFRYDLGDPSSDTVVVLPQGYGTGRLIRMGPLAYSGGKGPDMAGAEGTGLEKDDPGVWVRNMTVGKDHYPGTQFAQFMACYNEKAGIYIASEDTKGHMKVFKMLDTTEGIRPAISHVGDWPDHGSRRLEYDVVLGCFQGDWYSAADIYRNWSLSQKWGTRIKERGDVPGWLTDSPVYIAIHPESNTGQQNDPGIKRDDFIPFDKKLPDMLEPVSKKTDSSLAVILMGWEKEGCWVIPESFPWAGGDKHVKDFIRYSENAGWRTGTFSSGSRWVTGHINGYDGKEFYRKNGGELCVCRDPKGGPVRETFDVSWRPSYQCCLAADKTKEMIKEHVSVLVGWGMESIQFFDQNNGAATFPCYSREHGHPPVPGRWMAEAMEETVRMMHVDKKDVIQSVEAGANEYSLPLFQLTEFRLIPPGHPGHWGPNTEEVPIYQYLFHECILIQGMLGYGSEPFHVPMQNAVNCVWGSIPGTAMTGDGRLQDKDTLTFGSWEPRLGSDEDGLKMIRTVNALRKGAGRDFLVFGRMMRPGKAEGHDLVRFKKDNIEYEVPAVFHAAWQAQDGRLGFVFSNWTAKRQDTRFFDERIPVCCSGDDVILRSYASENKAAPCCGEGSVRSISLEPFSCALLEVTK